MVKVDVEEFLWGCAALTTWCGGIVLVILLAIGGL